MSHPPDLLKIAKRVVWFDAPEEALKRSRIFLAHLMNFGTEEDIQVARKYFSDEAFKDALEHATPGVFTHRVWQRWNMRYGRIPAPPLPKRFPDSPDGEELLWGRQQNLKKEPEPGDVVMLKDLPAGFIDDLPEEDQLAISAMAGKPVLLVEYDHDGRAEVEFTDSEGTTHFLCVNREFIATI